MYPKLVKTTPEDVNMQPVDIGNTKAKMPKVVNDQ